MLKKLFLAGSLSACFLLAIPAVASDFYLTQTDGYYVLQTSGDKIIITNKVTMNGVISSGIQMN